MSNALPTQKHPWYVFIQGVRCVSSVFYFTMNSDVYSLSDEVVE